MKKIILVCCFCMLATRSFAAQFPMVSYVLPSGITLFLALPNVTDAYWSVGTAIIVGASPNTIYDSLGTGGITHHYDDVAQVNIFERFRDSSAYTTGGCHYQNEHESSYSGTLYDLVIPDTITFPNGASFTVVHIAPFAFEHADWIHSVIIPNTIQYIREAAFFHCRNLEKIYFEPKNTGEDYGLYINQWAFAACYGLKKLEINRVCSVQPACFFNDVIDTVIINRNFSRTGLGLSSIYENMLTQTIVSARIYYLSPFYHQDPAVGINDTSWMGKTTLILGDSVTRVFGKVFGESFGGDTMIFPRGLKRLDHWWTLHHNYVLPDSLESFKQLNFQEATSLTIPDEISTWIRLGLPQYIDIEHAIYGEKIRKITIGKNISVIRENDYHLYLSSLDTVILRSRRIRQMSEGSFPIKPIVLVVPCGKLDDYRAMFAPSTVYLNIIEDTNCSLEVVVQSENEEYGTVSGGGIYHVNTSVTLTAIPNNGYEFRRWSNGSTSNPLTLTIIDDTVVTAYFRRAQNDISEIIDGKNKIITMDGYISVEGTTEDICIYDMMGRLMSATKGTDKKIFIPVSGVYMVKVGNYPARKVVVMR